MIKGVGGTSIVSILVSYPFSGIFHLRDADERWIVETMYWSRPETLGDVPPPCRAHTATLVDRKIVVFGGGQGPVYYDSTYIFDTVTRSWFRPSFPHSQSSLQNPISQPQNSQQSPVHPAPRRAHTAVLYNGKIYVFGGGNGLTALNDLWTLDVSRLDPTSQAVRSFLVPHSVLCC
jgi:UDP-N-acetylglucosamine:LPS N-acetylglucosamine transferase